MIIRIKITDIDQYDDPTGFCFFGTSRERRLLSCGFPLAIFELVKVPEDDL